MCWSFYLIFLFCNLGENICNEFEELNDILYQSEWYSFPNEVQRILPILLTASQEPVVLRGFGNLLCIRESFKRVRALPILH